MHLPDSTKREIVEYFQQYKDETIREAARRRLCEAYEPLILQNLVSGDGESVARIWEDFKKKLKTVESL